MVSVKDYYRILNIPSSASAEEIKKAFRKMALLYHPDRNSNTKLATEKFTEIQEAYSVLSDPKKRTSYNYQRYTSNPKWTFRQTVYTADEIIQLAVKLKNEVSRMDPFRIDRDHLYFEINDLLSAHNLAILISGDTDSTEKIIPQILSSCGPLSFLKKKEIAEKLSSIITNDPAAKKEIHHFLLVAKQQYYWGNYKVYIALAAAILFCLIVFYSGK